MLESLWFATFVVVAGGAMTGSFALPMKGLKEWSWENTWLVYSLSGLVAVPWLVASATVPGLLDVCRSVPAASIAVTALFGFGWGVANVLFGLAVSMAGMALGFAIVSGLSAALGSLIPLIVLTPDRIAHASGLLVLLGVALTVAGVFTLGKAGREKEKSAATGSARPVAAGILIAIVSGVLAPMLNFSFAFGGPVIEEATRHGAAPSTAVNAVWAIALAGGFVSNAGYSVLLLARNQTWRKYRDGRPGLDWALAVAMGVLYTGGIFLYGRGAASLGELGPAVGWPVFQATTIMTSSFLGALTGEWRGAGIRFFRMTMAGLALLVIAIVVLSAGNRAA